MKSSNQQIKEDFSSIDTDCSCYTCQNFSRAYIRHLLSVDEILGMTLCSIHSLHFYLELVNLARNAIIDGNYDDFLKENFQKVECMCD